MGWFGKESPLFGRQSKLGGAGNAQHPDLEFNAIPNWSARNQYVKDQEVMDPSKGNYYRVTRTDYSSDSVANDIASGLLVPMIPLPSPGINSVNYSNVAFVDPVHGNNATAMLGRFDLPWRTIPEAIAAATPGTSLSRRNLVWIRRGSHSASFTMVNFVDIYCDPDVLFNSGQITIDGVNANIYGFAMFRVGGSAMFFYGDCIGTYEFDSIISTAESIIFNTTCSGSLLIKADSINATIQSYGTITIGGTVNVIFDVKREIGGFAEIINFKYYSGRTIITCPVIKLFTGDMHGGDFKAAIKIYECVDAIITVNGNLYNEDPTNYMQNSGMIVFVNDPIVDFTLNGDIYGRGCLAIGLYNISMAKCTINGNMSSDVQIIYARSGEIIAKQSLINLSSVSTSNPIYLEESVKVNLIDCHIFNDVVDSDTIAINPVSTVDLNLYGCIGEQTGTGHFVSSIDPTGPTISVRVVNTMATHAIGVGVTNLIASNGFFQDANVQAVQF